MKKQSENAVKKAIKQYLEFNGFAVYRINNAGIYNAERKEFIWHGKKGMSDLIAIKSPWVLFIETKAPGKKLTVEQDDFLHLINTCSKPVGLYADSFDMFLEKFEDL